MSQHGELLAEYLLSLALDAGVPDSFWQTDKRIRYAREYLGWTAMTIEEIEAQLS